MREDILNLHEARFILFDVRFIRTTGFTKDALGYTFIGKLIYWLLEARNKFK